MTCTPTMIVTHPGAVAQVCVCYLKHKRCLIVSLNFGTRSIRTVISVSLNVWRSYGKCWYVQLAKRNTPRFPRYHTSFKMCGKKLPELSGNRKNVKQPIHSLKCCSAVSEGHKGSAFWTCQLALGAKKQQGFWHQTLRKHDLRLAECARVCVKICVSFCEVLNHLLHWLFLICYPTLSCPLE